MAAGTQLIRLAVFGTPVAHSLSPRIHTSFAQQLGLNVDYRAIEATADDFQAKATELERRGGYGCNVTVPLKRLAWRLANTSSETAARAEAANTLVFGKPGWFADNTDGRGLVNDLRSIPGCTLRGAHVCLLGAGGAAAGVLAALLAAEPARLVIANRTLARAGELARRHADLGKAEICQPQELGAMGPFDLAINATSLGHTGKAPPLDATWFNPGALCYDMNYGGASEPLRALCAGLGLHYADGLGMLVEQAALSFRLWTGRHPDTRAVLEELRHAAR